MRTAHQGSGCGGSWIIKGLHLPGQLLGPPGDKQYCSTWTQAQAAPGQWAVGIMGAGGRDIFGMCLSSLGLTQDKHRLRNTPLGPGLPKKWIQPETLGWISVKIKELWTPWLSVYLAPTDLRPSQDPGAYPLTLGFLQGGPVQTPPGYQLTETPGRWAEQLTTKLHCRNNELALCHDGFIIKLLICKLRLINIKVYI